MSNLPATTNEFSQSQIELIKSTVAKGATNDELMLFLHRCRSMGLDPLKPGMVHFIKYGNSPGTIVVGVDGFRSRALLTRKHVGTKRGLLFDAKGYLIGAWCEVYRSDWQHPAREEILRSEYDTQKAMWAKMPATMCKKVAEVAALRIAFPDELSGLYSHEEMDQANDERVISEDPNPWNTIIPQHWKSKDAGKTFRELGVDGVSRLIGFLKTKAKPSDENKRLLERADLALKTPQIQEEEPAISDDDLKFDNDLDQALERAKEMDS